MRNVQKRPGMTVPSWAKQILFRGTIETFRGLRGCDTDNC